MLQGILMAFIISLISGIYGYSHSESTQTYIAKLLFYVFLVVFLALIITSIIYSSPPPVREPMPAS